MQPKISVVMSVYNGENYLREAIGSILNQTFRDFEFIIIDDGSTDNTATILDSYTDARIMRLHNPQNIGLTRSLNRGLAVARGEYIARMDADDVSLSERLEKQVAYLDVHPEVGVLGTWIAYIDEEGQRMDVWRTPVSSASLRWSLLFGTSMVHPSVMMRRFLIERGVAYRSEILYAQDYDLWVRLSAKTQLANLPEVLYLRRVHKQMICVQHYEQQEQTVQVVMQHTIEKLLGEEVSETLVARLRHVTNGKLLETATELQAVANLIMHLYQAYIAQNMLNAAERKQVAEDAAYRLGQLASCHIRCWPLNASQVLLQALRLNPRLLTNKLYLKRLVYNSLKAKRPG